MQRIFILLCFSRSIRSLIRLIRQRHPGTVDAIESIASSKIALVSTDEPVPETEEALEKLPQRERDLIILHYYTGLTLKEVAVKMSMSYSNTKLVHNKALMLLRNRMDID